MMHDDILNKGKCHGFSFQLAHKSLAVIKTEAYELFGSLSF